MIKEFKEKYNSLSNSKLFPLLFLPLAVAFLLAFSPSTSPLWFYVGEDSAVFKSFGQAILKGKLIYQDIFDNKGPILYLINAIGQWICSGKWGIFAIQSICFSLVLYFMYRTARLFAGGLWATGAVLLTLFVYTIMIQDGNLCEEWMMFGFTIALFFAAKWVLDLYQNNNFCFDKKRLRRDSIIYGILLGYSFFIRPNDSVAIMGGLLIGIMLLLAIRHQWANILRMGLFAIIGFVTVALPIIIYFAIKHALPDLFYGIIGLNASYAGGINKTLRLVPPHKISLLLYSISICALAYGSRWRNMLFLLIPPLILELILMGDNMYTHYLIVLLPFFALAFSIARRVSPALAALAISILLIAPAPDTDGRLLARSARHMFTHKNKYINLNDFQKKAFTNANKIISLIPPNERDSVWNDLGGEPSLIYYAIFPYNNIVPCNKDVFRFDTIPSWNIRIRQELSQASPLPLWVLSSRRLGDPFLKDTLNIHQPYHLVGATDIYTLYKRAVNNCHSKPCHD